MGNLAELDEIREKLKNVVDMRENSHERVRIVVGMATCGISAGARDVLLSLTKEISDKKISDAVVLQTGCMGMCRFEPIVEVISSNEDKVTYVNVTPTMASEIINRHIIGGEKIEEYTLGYTKEGGK